MAYFSNSDGHGYTQLCQKCKNWVDKKDGRGFGCPIWDLHLIYNGDKEYQKILDFFIPDANEKCKMFLEDESKKNKKLFEFGEEESKDGK